MLEALSTMKKEFRDLRLCNWLAAYAIYQLEHFTDETAWFEWIYHIRTGMTRCKKETTICSWPGTVMIDQSKSSSRTRSKKEEEEEKEKEREPNMTDPAQPEKRKRKGKKKKRGRERPKPSSSWASPIEQLVGPNGQDFVKGLRKQQQQNIWASSKLIFLVMCSRGKQTGL